jgi:hypothetical protein
VRALRAEEVRKGITLLKCDRCGSVFGPMQVTHEESCPRCRARDGVWSPLTFVPYGGFGAIIPEVGAGFKVGRPPRDEGDASDELAKK